MLGGLFLCGPLYIRVRGKTIKTKISVFDTFFFVGASRFEPAAGAFFCCCPQLTCAHTSLDVAPRELFKHLQHGQSGLI